MMREAGADADADADADDATAGEKSEAEAEAEAAEEAPRRKKRSKNLRQPAPHDLTAPVDYHDAGAQRFSVKRRKLRQTDKNLRAVVAGGVHIVPSGY